MFRDLPVGIKLVYSGLFDLASRIYKRISYVDSLIH